MLVAGLRRVEERLDAVEQKLDKAALRSELMDLKARVDGLQQQVRVLEERLSAERAPQGPLPPPAYSRPLVTHMKVCTSM